MSGLAQETRTGAPGAGEEVRILATCTLGLGFSYRGLQAGLEQEPHLIACDAGSSDKGPYFLGSGAVSKTATSLKRDLGLLIEGARRLGVPFITGSAGGAGGRPHVEACVRLVKEIAAERGLHFRLAVISSEMSPELLKRKLREGRLVPCGEGVDEVTEASLDQLTAAVGMMGVEPYIRALEMGADVIIAGRSTDPSIFAGVPLRAGLDPGPVWHAAKCIDKGYLATTRPEDGSPVLARIRNDGFSVEAMRENSFCTVQTVAGIVLHENPDPFRIAQPTGSIDSSECVYEQIDPRTVRVRGSRYVEAAPTIKIDGAELVGHRTIMIAGIRDPRLIERIEEFLPAYREAVAAGARSIGVMPDQYQLQFRVYGRDGVMGRYETDPSVDGKELCLIADVVGKTPEISASVANRLAPNGSRLDIVRGLGGGGNFAFPFSPSVIKVGPAYKWSIWHLMQVDRAELTELFPIEIHDL